MKKESTFQKDLKKTLEKMFPNCIIFKNEPNAIHIQGFPDLTIIWHGKVAILECKRTNKSSKQPNQDYYIDICKKQCTYSNFINNENREEVLDELQRAFGVNRSARVSKS